MTAEPQFAARRSATKKVSSGPQVGAGKAIESRWLAIESDAAVVGTQGDVKPKFKDVVRQDGNWSAFPGSQIASRPRCTILEPLFRLVRPTERLEPVKQVFLARHARVTWSRTCPSLKKSRVGIARML